MRRVLQTLAALAALGVVGAAAVIGFGLYNVAARSGHLPAVSWALHTTYENAVELRAPAASSVPDLSDPALVELGARHFDRACRMCHAAPGDARTATVRAMVPPPPPITEAVEGWEPQHLHWIVHQGVKMSGMPAWPAIREDEVWAVVAFLTRVAEMEAADYAALTAAPEAEVDAALAYCAGCHGRDGRGELAPHVPRLDILGEPYIRATLDAYRERMRQSGFMQHAATEVSEADLSELARHYGAVAPEPLAGAEPEPEIVARGRDLAWAQPGDPDVPACRACHGPEAERASDMFPSLAGQHRAYLHAQLRLWNEGRRGGGKRADLMHEVARSLSEEDIEALAAYYAALPAAKRDEVTDPGRPAR